MHANTAIWSRGLLVVQLSVKSLDFVINKFFMELFRTSNMHVVSDCQEQFNFALTSVQLAAVLRNACWLSLFKFVFFLCDTSFWWMKDLYIVDNFKRVHLLDMSV